MKIKTEWILDRDLVEFIADEADIPIRNAKNIANLFEKENEVAYVARYCVKEHGGMSCEQLRKAHHTFQTVLELNKKAVKAIATIIPKVEGEDSKEEVRKLIKASMEPSDLVEISKMFSTGARVTKAGKARQLGFDQVAKEILAGNRISFRDFVGKSVKNEKEAHEHVKNLLADELNTKEVMEAARNIAKGQTKIMMKVISGLTTAAKKKEKEQDREFLKERSHFDKYVNFQTTVDRVQNFEILALNRAEEKGLVTWKIDVDERQAKYLHPGNKIRVHAQHVGIFQEALSQTITKQFIPKIQRMVKKILFAKAEESAIDCFAANLKNLFNTEPVPPSHVIALDPGFSACKAAFLAPSGAVLATKQFKLNGRTFDRDGRKTIEEWTAQGDVLIVIGNGKASFETQTAVADLIRGGVDAQFCVVSEAGASKYSITELAEQDLPGMPPTERSAVSLGRRLLDPMAELVKVEPKHLGVGMYQHSVNPIKLTKTLEQVVGECVSMRGVDLNTASIHLLRYVCGLNKTTAKGVIDLREKQGRIESREQLKLVKGLGEKSFEQCAGFLLINEPTRLDEEPPRKKKKKEAWNWLDSTIVHPSQYQVAQRILERVGKYDSIENLQEHAPEMQSEEEQEVFNLLISKTKLVPHPKFMKNVREVGSLKKGERMEGIVTNKTDFGAFVDIGVGKDGLIHSSQFKGVDIEIGSRVQVIVFKVELDKGKLSLNLA